MQEKRNQRVHYPQGPLQRGMQPLRLSLLHLGILDPSKGRDGVFIGWRDSQKSSLAPEGQRLRERYQTLDVGRSLPGVRSTLSLRLSKNYIPLPKIGEGLGEWSEALSYGKRGMGKMRDSKALPCDGVRGFPRKCPFEGVCWSDNDD